MKRCPQCNRVETDETLKFCRVDGTALIFFDAESPTAVFGTPEVVRKSQTVSTRTRRSAKSKSIDSLAVLPFENVSNDPNAEYLSDGITESIINNLSQLARLKVMARSTVFSYKGQSIDARRAGNELGGRAVVTGRVLHVGDRLQIGVELVDVSDGTQLWGERYSRTMADVFMLQEQISEEISDKLKLKLTGPQKKRLGKQHPKNSEAYQLYLKGRFFWNKHLEEGARRAIEYFQQALTIDASFALAYTGLADAQILLGDTNIQAVSPKEAFWQGKQSVARALELDDDVAEAHGTMGHVSMHLFDWPKAEKELRRALELNPNYAQGCVWQAYYFAFMARFDESIASINRALELDPLTLNVNASKAQLLDFAGRFDEAIEHYHKTIEMEPRFWSVRLELGRADEEQGRYKQALAEFSKAREISQDSNESLACLAHCFVVTGATSEAKALLQKLMELSEQRYVSAYDLAIVHCGLGQKDKAFEWLNRGYEINDGWMIYLTVDPRFKPLYSDPRFGEIARRVGLPH
jgi:TolB-like protein/Tfp pilus assembly protein PilF